MDSDIASEAMSVTSTNYVFRKNGEREYPWTTKTRTHNRYHAFETNPYPYPADEQESSRLDAMHHSTRVLFRKNVLAPIEDLPKTQIVDLGTGSGIPRECQANEKAY